MQTSCVSDRNQPPRCETASRELLRFPLVTPNTDPKVNSPQTLRRIQRFPQLRRIALNNYGAISSQQAQLADASLALVSVFGGKLPLFPLHLSDPEGGGSIRCQKCFWRLRSDQVTEESQRDAVMLQQEAESSEPFDSNQKNKADGVNGSQLGAPELDGRK